MLRLSRSIVIILSGAVAIATANPHLALAQSEPTQSLSTTTPFWRKSTDTKFAYKIESGFDSFANAKEQSQYFGLGLGAKAQLRLLPRLTLSARARAQVVSGYAQSQFGDNVGANGLFLQEALMNVKVIDSEFVRLNVGGGALDQSELEARLLVDSQAFPGAKESLSFGTKAFEFKIWAQQTIPTSKNLSTKTVDAEVTPSFTTETAELNIQPGEGTTAKIYATHFLFNNLPSAIATESVVYGNTVDETGPNTSRFKYRFEGIAAGGKTQIMFTRGFGVGLNGYAVQNAAAPESYRNAQYLGGNLLIGLPGEVDVTPGAAVFFAEDDVAPGFYNASDKGHNNRQGWEATLETLFREEKFKVKASYIDADLINASSLQSRQQFFMIRFETLYELL